MFNGNGLILLELEANVGKALGIRHKLSHISFIAGDRVFNSVFFFGLEIGEGEIDLILIVGLLKVTAELFLYFNVNVFRLFCLFLAVDE